MASLREKLTRFRMRGTRRARGPYDRGVRRPQEATRACRFEAIEDRFLLSTVGNFIWNDLNANGVQDLGEPGTV
jgi:hypothetical protein